MEYLSVDEDTHIYYEHQGYGSVVVWLHDGLIHRATWDAQWDAFVDRYSLIRYDRRGYGHSDEPTAPYSDVEDLHLLLEYLEVMDAVIVASSAGSNIALEFAVTYPRMVERLILVGPVVGGLAPSEHFVHRGQANFKPLVDQGDIETTIENWTHDPYWIAPGNDHAGQLFQMLLSNHPQNISHLSHFAQNMDPPILSRLSEIDVPTLLITGESDHPDIHAHAGAIQAGIAQAQRIIFPRAGHLVHMERPDAFNRLVDAFIKTVFTG